MDLARSMCYLKYALHRVRWPEYGVLVESMLWARRKARFTYDFESGWRVWRCTDPASTVAALTHVEWYTLGEVCTCVYADLEAARGRGLRGHKAHRDR